MPKPSRTTQALTRLFVLAAAALAVVGVSACDAAPAPDGAAPRQVTVVGVGQVDGTPDTLTIGIAIEATAPDAAGASNQTSGRVSEVIDAIAGQGVDRKDISTTQVSLQPQYGGPDGNAIVGYRSSNSIDLKVRDITKGPQVLGVLTTVGGNATRINSVAYSFADDSQLVKDARSRAFNDAKDRADQYAGLSGLKLGKVLSISETGSGTAPQPPTPVRFDAVAAAPVPMSPGQQTVGFSVTVVWELS
jgi:uncharacterized protein